MSATAFEHFDTDPSPRLRATSDRIAECAPLQIPQMALVLQLAGGPCVAP